MIIIIIIIIILIILIIIIIIINNNNDDDDNGFSPCSHKTASKYIHNYSVKKHCTKILYFIYI